MDPFGVTQLGNALLQALSAAHRRSGKNELKGDMAELEALLERICLVQLKVSNETLANVKANMKWSNESLELLGKLDEETFPQLQALLETVDKRTQDLPRILEAVKRLETVFAPPSVRHGLPSPTPERYSEEWFRLQRILGILGGAWNHARAWESATRVLELREDWLRELANAYLVKRNTQGPGFVPTETTVEQFYLRWWNNWASKHNPTPRARLGYQHMYGYDRWYEAIPVMTPEDLEAAGLTLAGGAGE